VPALAELIVGGYRIGAPSLWRDEAATISGSRRPVTAILAMIGHEDAVHGPYYLMMHPVIAAGGSSATTLRLPSLIAMCLAVGLTAALGRRLALASGLPGAAVIGLVAGLALTAVPLTTRYAQEARPYALATLFAVLATYFLVRAADKPRPAWWAMYAAALLLTGLFNLLAAVLLAAAHSASLAWARRPAGGEAGVAAAAGPPAAAGSPSPVTAATFRRWLAACAVAAVLLAPIAYLSAGQSAQLNWVRRPGLSTLATLAHDFAGAGVLIPVIGALAVLGCLAGPGLGRGGMTMTAVALPWLVLPPALLIAVSLAHPIYVERYVVFCLPALAVLTAAGLTWLAAAARRGLAGRGLGSALADLLSVVPPALLALVIAAALTGPQREIRLPGARVDNLRQVAAVIAKHERPGDAVLYLPQDAALVGVAYPTPFRRLRDIGLGRSAVASATLRGLPARPGVVAARLRSVRRLWTVQWAVPLSRSSAAPASLMRLLTGLRVTGRWHIQSVILRLYLARAR
jgi:mannosyltransferase